jgi:hypothetical protein
MRGYSIEVAEAIWKGDQSRLGVRLGKLCIQRRVPVAKVAGTLGVSRQTIYNWFVGAYDPAESHKDAVEKFLASLD